jgi:predicted RND superfamily exporter protein
MLLILISFPVALVIYKLIFRISNLSSLHLMIVFVVLGVAVDNIFVIWDAWTQSEQIKCIKNDQKKRMAYTFRRAAHSISATSSTTAFAFLSNGFSSLMPLSAFGYFCFVVVPVNFAL